MEISEAAFSELNKFGWQQDRCMLPNLAPIRELFERAETCIRELGDEWVAAQLRMIGAMRAHTEEANKTEEVRTNEQL